MTAVTERADPAVGSAPTGNVHAFATLVERHRRELHRHCHRILRSPERADDAVQETLLRAWRARADFAGRATLRSWLHRIATNACLDEIRRGGSRGTVALDDEAPLPPAPAALGPEAVQESREALEQAMLAVAQLLPPRQRAVLVLRGVLGCPAGETARLLGTTTAAVNSALQRARATLTAAWPVPATDRLDPHGRALLHAYVDALRHHDVARVVDLARADVARPAAA